VTDHRPNLVFVMSDDHASHALSAYGSRINRTPHLDRIAEGGMRFDAAFCTNSICTPSRAAVLTGTYNHVNGVTTLDTPMDNRLPTFVTALRSAGYQTAVFGKWHLGHGAGHDPAGFDEWRVLPDQGEYHDPLLLGPTGPEQHSGYVTDIITDLCLDWLERRDPDRPFALLCHHKAPHRTWEPDAAHAHLFDDVDIPLPETLWDDHATRSQAVRLAELVLNVDLAPTFCDLAGLAVPTHMQGTSFRPLLRGDVPHDWQRSMYYRYWMHRDDAHRVPAHYGVRTLDHKLICFYGDPLDQPGAHGPVEAPEWELYDLRRDPFELRNVAADPAYAAVRASLLAELERLQAHVGDTPVAPG
jgi:arylsulfatase A-like enzyme